MYDHPPASTVRVGTLADLNFVVALQRKFSNQLGFLPRAALQWYLEHGRCVLVSENGDPAGYVLGRPRLRAQNWVQPITQTAVCLDAQRRYLGQALLDWMKTDALASGRTILQAWCRVDIEATAFWNAGGFEPIALRRPPNSRHQPLLLWRRCLHDAQRPLMGVVPAATGWKASTSTAVEILTPGERQLYAALAELNDLDQVARLANGRRGLTP